MQTIRISSLVTNLILCSLLIFSISTSEYGKIIEGDFVRYLELSKESPKINFFEKNSIFIWFYSIFGFLGANFFVFVNYFLLSATFLIFVHKAANDHLKNKFKSNLFYKIGVIFILTNPELTGYLVVFSKEHLLLAIFSAVTIILLKEKPARQEILILTILALVIWNTRPFLAIYALTSFILAKTIKPNFRNLLLNIFFGVVALFFALYLVRNTSMAFHPDLFSIERSMAIYFAPLPSSRELLISDGLVGSLFADSLYHRFLLQSLSFLTITTALCINLSDLFKSRATWFCKIHLSFQFMYITTLVTLPLVIYEHTGQAFITGGRTIIQITTILSILSLITCLNKISLKPNTTP